MSSTTVYQERWRRIVEFLNAQMDPAHVLAVGLCQYVGEGQRAMVQRVFGQIEQARIHEIARCI
jgi:hypothetical protein